MPLIPLLLVVEVIVLLLLFSFSSFVDVESVAFDSFGDEAEDDVMEGFSEDDELFEIKLIWIELYQ